MEHVVSATEARIRFGELMRRAVEGQEPIIVERAGTAEVVVLSIDLYRQMIAEREDRMRWPELLQQAREQIRAELGDRALPQADELIRRMREERDAALVDLC